MNSAGYSKTPLTKKLGIKTGFKILLINEPAHYLTLLSELPEDVDFKKNAVKSSLDFIHWFCKTKSDLKKHIDRLKNALKADGMLWISWPKGSSSIETDLNRDEIRTFVLESGLVDIKVAAIDEDWSGLKFVYRIKDRN